MEKEMNLLIGIKVLEAWKKIKIKFLSYFIYMIYLKLFYVLKYI